MPRYRIIAPNGKTYELDGPAGASQAQIQSEVMRQHPEAAQAKPQHGSFLQELGNAAEAVGGTMLKGAAALPDMLAQGGHAVGKMVDQGIAGVGSAILDAAGRPDLGVKFGNYVTKEAVPFKTVSQMVDERLPAARPENLAPGVNLAGQILGSMATPDPLKVIMGEPPKQLDLSSLKTKPAASAASQVISEGEKNGVRVFTTDVKPPASAAGQNIKQVIPEKIPITGMGGPRAAQQAERVAAVQRLVSDFGGDVAPDVFQGNSGIVDDLAKNLSQTRAAKLSSLTTAKDSIINGIAGAVPTPKAVEAIDQQIAKLQGINPDKFAPVIRELDGFKQVLASGKTLDQIEGNRKLLGDLFKDPNLASIAGDGQKAINKIYGPLREDMGNFIAQQAGSATASKWKVINDQLSGMAGELNATAFKRALQTGDITPENVAKMLFSRNPSDVQRLVENLDAAGQAKAKQAIVQRAFDKAISANEGLSIERFTNNLKGMSDNIGVAFSPDEQARVKGLVRLLDATRRASAAMANPPTGNRNVLGVVGIWLGQAMGFGSTIASMGGAGLLSRLYESPATRNLLVGFSKTQPGSKAEAAMFRKLIEAGAIVAAKSKALNDNVSVEAAAARQKQEQQQGQ